MVGLRALHFESAGTRRFALLHEPRVPIRGLVVHVHAFAEEMNKSRRMVALQARALADRGYAVLVPDLYGCGDSDGDFGDATWLGWMNDVLAGVAWMRERFPASALPMWLWGLRAGCLLAAASAARMTTAPHLLLWQPPSSGRSVLQQFLRLQMAANLSEGTKGIVESLRRRLQDGEAIEVAGYWLHPQLALPLEHFVWEVPAISMRVAWLEVSGAPQSTLLPTSERLVVTWREAGCAVDAAAVSGAAFWLSVETEEAPVLRTETLRMLDAIQRRPEQALAAETLA